MVEGALALRTLRDHEFVVRKRRCGNCSVECITGIRMRTVHDDARVLTDQRQRLLVVEDEHKVANALREGLEGEGYKVVAEETGEGAFFRIKTETFDCTLLDLGLPDRDGLDILRALRQQSVETPVVVVTARDTLDDRVSGLETGADDYLIKPFAFAELLARIQAVMRRDRGSALLLEVGDLRIDVPTRQVTRGGLTLTLTPTEFGLLDYLMRHERQVVSRDTLARELWRDIVHSVTLDNVIDVQVSRLRRKVDRDGWVTLIHTVRGVGFVLQEDER